MSGAICVETPCKVNLHLGAHAEWDARGYHRVDSLMVPVALFDTVRVEEAPQLEVRFSPSIGVDAERSGVWRAVELLAAVLGEKPCVRVSVSASIPERAGLGGSSADAGAALRALAAYWGVDALDARVVAVARKVGADVPFFLDPRPGFFVSAGDVLERALPCPELPLALVMPRSQGGSTPEAYAEFDRSGSAPVDAVSMCAALISENVRAIAAALYNNLADAVTRLCPEAGEVERWLREQPGVLGAQITGSGTCSFAICESYAAVERVVSAAIARGWRGWATKTVGSAVQVC